MMFNYISQYEMPYIYMAYGEYEAIVYFDGELIDGYIPVKQIKLVSTLVVIHDEELQQAWSNAVNNNPFNKITILQ